MRAGRLLHVLLALQSGGRVSARDLAQQLEVSERTILRDIEVLSGSGVPVYGVRGPGGGFELLDTFNMAVPSASPGLTSTAGRLRRVRVRLSPTALQRAIVTGKPEAWRERPSFEPADDRPDWLEGSFRFTSYDAAVRELGALGPDIEVLLPVEVRHAMADFGNRLVALNS